MSFAKAEALTVWVIWLTYGSFYFCRTNISAAVKGIEDEFHYDNIGWILAALKIAYAAGQFLNGQLAERFSARKLLAIGMLGSAGLNVAFGLSTGFYFLLFIWALNGYCQALGWTPCMRVAANWFPPDRRGQRIGIIGTGYQAAAALTYVISTQAVAWFGWRFAFYIPALMLAASCVHMLVFLREAPRGDGAAPASSTAPENTGGVREGTARPFLQNVRITLTNPSLWFLAVSLGLLNACRYGYLDWGLTHLLEVRDTNIGKVGIKYAVLPLGGIAGAFLAGWASDRFFDGRRAPVITILLLCLSALSVAYGKVENLPEWAIFALLVCVGFTIYGPQVLLVGTAPVDLARAGTPAAAVGFVNFMGYVGAAAGDVVTGELREFYGDWSRAVYFWAGCALVSAIFAALLWTRKAES